MSTTLTRRGLGAAAAGLTLFFSLSPAPARRRRLPGSLQTNRQAGCLAADQRGWHASPSAPARWRSARAR